MTEPFDAEKRTDQFIRLRDKIKEIETKQEEELKPYKDMLAKLGGELLEHLNKTGAQSVKTKFGTPYKSTKVSVTVADKSAFWTWMVASDNLDFLDIKANQTAVKTYMEEQTSLAEKDPNITPSPPPGINYSTWQDICVTRGRASTKRKSK